MKRAPEFEAVLVSCGSYSVTAESLTPMIVDVLREHGEMIPGLPVRSDDGKTVTGRTIWVQARELPVADDRAAMSGRTAALNRQAGLSQGRHSRAAEARGKLSITVGWHGTDGTDPGQRPAGILADLIYEVVMQAPVDYVAWLSEEVLLTPGEFLSAYEGPSAAAKPARADTDPQAHAEPSETSLSDGVEEPLTERLMDELPLRGFGSAAPRFRTPETDVPEAEEVPSDQLRLASWAITGTVATLSLPVAAAVAVVSLGKGEDFRLSTHALSVTGLFAALSASGVDMALPFF